MLFGGLGILEIPLPGAGNIADYDEHSIAAITTIPVPDVHDLGIVKFTLIGSIIGTLIIVIFHLAVYIAGVKVRTVSDIQNVTSADVVFVYSKTQNEKGLGKLAALLEGRAYHTASHCTTVQLREFLSESANMPKEILLFGLESKEKLEMLKQQLGSDYNNCKLTFCPADACGNSEKELVENSDAVIIAAEKDVTKMRTAKQKADLAKASGKPIVACILV